MAINLLGNTSKPTTNYNTLTPAGKTYGSLSSQPINAQSVTTGKPVSGSISPTPMGVTSKSPSTNVTAPATTLPKSQVATPALNQPGGTNSMGTHILTQAELDAQNATPKASPPQQQNTNYQYDASGKVQANPNAAPGTAGSADPTLQSSNNETPPATSPISASTPQPQYSATNPVTQSGLLGQAANMASAPTANYQQQLANANQYNEALKKSKFDEAQAIANIQGSPHTLNFAQGAENVIRNQALAQQQGLSTAFQGASNLVGNATQQQGTQQQGLLSAAQGAAPVQVSPGNYLSSPFAVAPNATAGQQQGIQAATNWAIAQQNMAQGRNYQGISQELSNAIQTMEPIGRKLTDFVTATGQNPATSPLINEQIGKVNSQLYPAQVATLNAAVNDIRSYAVQILGSQSGANPTDVTNAVNSFDFSKFSAKDLADFLGDLNNLGHTRLSQAQSAMNAGYGANNTVGTPAAGVTGTDQGAFNTGSMTPSSMASNIGKTLLGSIASVGGIAADAAKSQAGAFIGGGIAEKVLGL